MDARREAISLRDDNGGIRRMGARGDIMMAGIYSLGMGWYISVPLVLS